LSACGKLKKLLYAGGLSVWVKELNATAEDFSIYDAKTDRHSTYNRLNVIAGSSTIIKAGR